MESATHLDLSFVPSRRRQILHIATAMRLVCLLDRTKNLSQSEAASPHEGRLFSPPRGGIYMDTYEFLSFLIVYTILILSVKR